MKPLRDLWGAWIGLGLIALFVSSCIPLPRFTITTKVSAKIDTSRERAAFLAGKIAPALAKLEADLKAGKTRKISQVRRRVQRILSAPELAAARDFVLAADDDPSLESFHPSRRSTASLTWQLEESSVAQAVPRKGFETQRRAWRPGRATAAEAPRWLTGLLLRIAEVRRRAENDDLLTTICVGMQPESPGVFRLWPASYPKGAQEAVIRASFRVYRGIYFYRSWSSFVSPQTQSTIECQSAAFPPCARLDLMTDSRPAFQCDLVLKACSRKADLPAGCSSP